MLSLKVIWKLSLGLGVGLILITYARFNVVSIRPTKSTENITHPDESANDKMATARNSMKNERPTSPQPAAAGSNFTFSAPTLDKCTLQDRQIGFTNMCKIAKPPSGRLRMVHRNSYFSLRYCPMPKAGSGTMNRVLSQLKPYARKGIPTVSGSSAGRPIGLLVVRHPLARLRSVYKGRLSRHFSLNNSVLGKHIKLIDQYFKEHNIQRNSSFDPKSEFLSFEQFLDILARKYHVGFKDPHWNPISGMCKLCHIPYNTLLRLETFDEDMLLLEEQFRKKAPELKLTVAHRHDNNAGVPSSVKESSDSLLFGNISRGLVQRVLDVYNDDMRILGYHWDQDTGLTCRYHLENHDCC